jgi:2-oxoisovalerate dehydrogenase E1 component
MQKPHSLSLKVEDFFLALKIRFTEQKLLEIFSKGLLRGTVHTCIGQEFSAVLIGKYLDNRNDWVLSTHRGHGHFLSFNGSPFELFAELLGKKDGPSNGLGGSQHIKKGNFITNGVQGGFMPVASGIASVLSETSETSICVNFIGDGTLGEGSVWESLNSAAVLSVPCLYVCEDNGIAQSTLTANTFRGDLSKRVEGFGIKYIHTSLNNLESAEFKIKSAIDYVRNTRAPVFLHLKTERLNAHSKGDDNRDPAFIAKITEMDKLNQFLKNYGEVYKNEILEIRKMVDQDFEKALKLFSEKVKFITANKINKNTNLQARIPDTEIFRIQLNKSLENGLNEYPELKIFGEDIEYLSKGTTKPYGGAFKVTNQLSKIFPNRVSNFPIAENSLVGFAIGRALAGAPTITEIMFGDFITLAFDQIVQNMSKIPSMYGIYLDLPILIRTPMGGGFGYGATHSQSLEKHFLGLPNITLVAINVFSDLDQYFSRLLKTRTPHIVVENKRDYFLTPSKVLSKDFIHLSSDETYKIHNLIPKNAEPTATFLTYGGMSSIVHVVQEKLFGKGINTNLVIIEKLSPLNYSEFSDLIKEKLIIVEEGIKHGGIGSEILAQMSELEDRPKKVLRISGIGIIGSSKASEEMAIPTIESLYNSSLEFLSKD